jgi:hypothetical protein
MPCSSVEHAPAHPLLRNLLGALKGRLQHPPLTPREKAHVLITALHECTMACLTEQAHLFGYDRKQRHAALNALAKSFGSGEWIPEGLSGEEMRMVGEGMIADIVHRIANGYGVSGYEVKLHELFQAQTLPEMRPAGDRPQQPRNQRRAYYHV